MKGRIKTKWGNVDKIFVDTLKDIRSKGIRLIAFQSVNNDEGYVEIIWRKSKKDKNIIKAANKCLTGGRTQLISFHYLKHPHHKAMQITQFAKPSVYRKQFLKFLKVVAETT